MTATPDAPSSQHDGWIEPAEFVPADLPGLWYAAHTRARNEKALVEQLLRRRIPNYLPLARRETRSRRTGRISRSLVPVFPGYVFFNATEQQRYQALTTNRIARVLVVADQRQLIAELQRIALLLKTDQDFAVVQRIEVGDWGRIIAGPLRGLEGVVARHAGRWRLSMNVTILGQSANVEVDRDQVERIDPPSWQATERPRNTTLG
ncbi:MAG: UpxY family transcription antiterminator [Planctomycetes bacterium]|nr:UpxY family transcription antiterminator [Planctomycetota bacterium]